MFLYCSISSILSMVAWGAWMVVAVTHVPTFHGDGAGPDGVVIVLYLSLWPVGILLAHSALLAWMVRAKNPTSVMQGRWGLSLHGVLGAALSLCALKLFYLS